jgi:hypothetical protein
MHIRSSALQNKTKKKSLFRNVGREGRLGGKGAKIHKERDQVFNTDLQ